jgi:hypothetical protein
MSRNRLKLRLWLIEMEGEGLAAVVGGLFVAALAIGLHYANQRAVTSAPTPPHCYHWPEGGCERERQSLLGTLAASEAPRSP